MSSEEAAQCLRRAHELHAAGDVLAAIREARRALELQPDYVPALTYVGTTLVTRRLAYEEGLEFLERAVRAAPDDAAAHYSLGWCYEFVAYRLQRSGARPYRDPGELYELAADELRRCIELEPEQGLKEDAEDLLAAIEPRLS